MALYPNGLIPTAALDAVPAANGQTAWLLPGPAASLLRVQAECRRRHGWTPLVTSAGDGFRSLMRQEAVFRQRYRPTYSTVFQGGRYVVDRRTWDGRHWWRFTGSAAAVPGTSNHGKGITVDLSGLGWFGTTRWDQLAPILAAEGWSNAEGRSVSEPWHWNYTRSAYTIANTNLLPGVSITLPGGTLPDPLTPEDDMYSDDDRARDTARAKDAAETLRLVRLMVLAPSGHGSPATEQEAVYVQTIRGLVENAAEARKAPLYVGPLLQAILDRSDVDEGAVAAAVADRVVAALPTGTAGVTAATVTEAVREALRTGTGG